MTTALEGGEGSASRPSRSLPLGKNWYPLYRRLGGPVWTGVENLAPTGIRSPDHPAHSQSLYRLCCPAHRKCKWCIVNWTHAKRYVVTTSSICLFLFKNTSISALARSKDCLLKLTTFPAAANGHSLATLR